MESILTQTTSPACLVGAVAVLAFAATNPKSLPFTYTIQLLPSIYRLLKPRLSKRSSRPETGLSIPDTQSPVTAKRRLFTHHTTHSRATISDLGIALRKSNSTFFIDADISRAELLTTLFSEALAGLGPANFLLESVQCKFLADIRPYAAYVVSSRVLAWNERSFYVVTYFLKPGADIPWDVEVLGGPQAVVDDGRYKDGVFSVMLSKHVFMAKKLLSPREVLHRAGLLLLQGEGEKREGCDGDAMAAEAVEQAVQWGLEYVSGCMG
ncbi:hypothetical protein ASPVEDRAFT_32141 [Aspergillus versicolor CBS 583.65]|uniref:Thioesterase domain-containing protein n=1 Tax=Aspergillus versicolor CBS 583.65 TaxID=1036611 RepID=A0A1L9PWF8_ASPVE|nr:uncharacterized protein ASPVEDRAFT_32141 [Aspergillus versicolor CBS 583.65]OJJ05785.1 hypothetical protein ASPVEDRAFT_32141 [Aspergillus versicolor CBS 583.65]